MDGWLSGSPAKSNLWLGILKILGMDRYRGSMVCIEFCILEKLGKNWVGTLPAVEGDSCFCGRPLPSEILFFLKQGEVTCSERLKAHFAKKKAHFARKPSWAAELQWEGWWRLSLPSHPLSPLQADSFPSVADRLRLAWEPLCRAQSCSLRITGITTCWREQLF